MQSYKPNSQYLYGYWNYFCGNCGSHIGALEAISLPRMCPYCSSGVDLSDYGIKPLEKTAELLADGKRLKEENKHLHKEIQFLNEEIEKIETRSLYYEKRVK